MTARRFYLFGLLLVAIESRQISSKVIDYTCTLPIVVNGSIEKETADGKVLLRDKQVPVDTEIVISCDLGYVVEKGASRLVCQRSGLWTAEPGECIKASPTKGRNLCLIPLVENGSVRLVNSKRRLGRKARPIERMAPGVRIHLRCDRDFYLSEGAYEATCNDDGAWTIKLGKCQSLFAEEEDCTEEPTIAHATLLPRSVGTRTIKCDDGYDLMGAGVARCLKDGVWSFIENSCQRACGHAPSIANGVVGEGGRTIGSERVVACFTGYELKGAGKIECNSTGHWSEPGKCERTCTVPPVISNGSLLDGPSWIGSERKIKCNDGFALSGVDTVKCNSYGRWIVGGVCRKSCGIEPGVLNGAIQAGEFAVGAERSVSCNVGYVLKGPTTIRCSENGEWSDPGFCKRESIHMAAELGDIYSVKSLIHRQPELLEVKNAYGDSPLWRAAHNGQLEVVKLLLSEGANIESRGLYGRTPLHEAAALGHSEVVKVLLKNGANVYAVSNEPDSQDLAIHLAAFEGHLDIVRAFIEASPDLVDKKDVHGRTPLDLAKLSHNSQAAEIIRFLKSKICDSEPVIPHGHLGNGSSSISGERSVHCEDGYTLQGPNKVHCKPNGQWSEPGICTLAECGAVPVVPNGRVGDGLHSVGSERAVTCLYGFELSGSNKVICDRNAKWTSPGTCQPSESIFWAATMGHETVVRVLLTQKPELLEERDRSNTTILAIAASYGQQVIVEYLLALPGVNVEARDKDGRTALALAALRGHLRIVKLLAKKGANLHAKSNADDYEDQSIHHAALAGHTEIVEFLISEDRGLLTAKNRDGDHPIHRAVVGGHVDTVKALLNLGANVESRNNDGWTPLCHAAAEGNVEIVRLLIERGANFYARSNVDDDEDMPIHLASYFGHLNVVQFLTEKKPDLLTVRNKEGESPINRAAVGGHTGVVEYLLSKGVDVETRGFRGRTPLHEAASKGHLKLAKMLIRHNANITARSDRDSDRGSLPIHLASYFGQLDVVRYLIETKPELISAKNARGQTPLEHAVAGGSVHHAQDVVRFLSDKVGASVGESVLP